VKGSKKYQATVAGSVQVLLAAVRDVEAAGSKPVIILSPDVEKCLRDANHHLPDTLECIVLPVHPSGARGDPVVWDALRTDLEPVQTRIYAIENTCTREEAAAAVGELRSRNHANVMAFCAENCGAWCDGDDPHPEQFLLLLVGRD
jgi:hypothetical protein